MQKNILEYLEQTVKTEPDKTAFANETEPISFRSIYNNARSIGSYLNNCNIYNKPVAVLMGKKPRTIAVYLGVVYSGCYYVPIDTEMPDMRIQLILGSLNNCPLICDNETKDTINYNGRIMVYEEIISTSVCEESLNHIRTRQIDTDPVYIVFTSGSTGVPKGVTACHRSVIDYVDNLTAVMGFTKDSIFGNQAPQFVDGLLKDMFPTLKLGATTYLIPKKLFMFPVLLVEFLNKYQINTICWVASALSMVSSFGTFEKLFPLYLKTIASGSELFPVKQLNIWKKYIPNARYFNLYGPTEATGMSCYYEIKREFDISEIIPIGQPFPNTEVLLIDGDKRVTGINEMGEICIRGTSLALGYYRDFTKTNDVFVQNPLNNLYPELIYLTGDIGKYNDKNELCFVSRKDNQIKHMGYRIELSEIENAACAIENINNCCCFYDNDNKKIVLCYIGIVEEGNILKSLKLKLPRYMIPNVILKLDYLPYTLNGKIDRLLIKQNYTKRNGD